MQDTLGEVNADTVLAAGVPKLQEQGMTFRKAEYIADFAEKVHTGTFDPGAVEHMSDEEYGLPPPENRPQLFEKYRRRFRPYCSVASLYLWAVAGGAIPEIKDYKPKNGGKEK